MGSIADSVLPVAVGEMSKTFLPSRILGITFFCGSVGVWNPFCSTSLRMGFTNCVKTFPDSAFKNALRLQTQKNSEESFSKSVLVPSLHLHNQQFSPYLLR